MYRQGQHSAKNSEYVCGIPLPNTDNRRQINTLSNKCTLYGRFKGHSRARSHILACSDNSTRNAEGAKNEPEEQISLPEIGENEPIMEPTVDEIKNKIDEQTRAKLPPDVLRYLENWVMKKHTWVEICDGKLFCQVNLTVGVVKLKSSFRLIGLKV